MRALAFLGDGLPPGNERRVAQLRGTVRPRPVSVAAGSQRHERAGWDGPAPLLPLLAAGSNALAPYGAGQRPRYAPSPYSSHPSGRPPADHASRRQRLRLVEVSCGRDQTSGLASSRSVDTVVYQTDDPGSCQPTRGQGRCGWRFMDGFHKQRPHPFWGHGPTAVMAAVREDRH